MASGVDAKLLKSTKFPTEFNQKVDMQKVNLQVMKKWIAGKVIEILGDEDDVVIELIFNLIEGSRNPDIKSLQIHLTGFLDKYTAPFCKELWKLLKRWKPTKLPRKLVRNGKKPSAEIGAAEAAPELLIHGVGVETTVIQTADEAVLVEAAVEAEAAATAGPDPLLAIVNSGTGMGSAVGFEIATFLAEARPLTVAGGLAMSGARAGCSPPPSFSFVFSRPKITLAEASTLRGFTQPAPGAPKALLFIVGEFEFLGGLPIAKPQPSPSSTRSKAEGLDIRHGQGSTQALTQPRRKRRSPGRLLSSRDEPPPSGSGPQQSSSRQPKHTSAERQANERREQELRERIKKPTQPGPS
ncbi:hypothetical protein P8C59_004962 [Phyllachora maydis]|uniref:PWI domain-containing protein n=1 Tax=Phyllachora maydis TaxID=1825666 RepID=A0AAD9MBT6_9PEZI|nr:hypothetical protein P8C59_004962 [Phyllachora maydis]